MAEVNWLQRIKAQDLPKPQGKPLHEVGALMHHSRALERELEQYRNAALPTQDPRSR